MSSLVDKTQELRNKCLLDFLVDRSGKVLDVGCQQGDMCQQLLVHGYEPYGVEIVEELVQKARSRYPKIHFECADCEQKIPFDDGLFDIVWAGDIIEHVRFTDVFVNEVNRVLKTGGLFILTTPMHNVVKNLIISLCNFEQHFNPEFPHLRFFTRRSLSDVLTARGFEIIKVKHLGRVSLVAKSMFVVAEKRSKQQVLSRHRY